MTRKIKRKEDENRSLRSQVLHSASFDLRPFRLVYIELDKSILYKLNFFRFLTQRPIILPNSNIKQAYMREI